MTNKQAARARAEAWKKALREYRVVQYLNGLVMKEYKTAGEAKKYADTYNGKVIMDYKD